MLRARLNDDLKHALKAKDQLAVATLRLILAALKDRDIAARGKGNSDGVKDEEILELLQKMVRQRRESIEAYRNGGRQVPRSFPRPSLLSGRRGSGHGCHVGAVSPGRRLPLETDTRRTRATKTRSAMARVAFH